MLEFNETDQAVNSSLCCISSLEVYRGRQQAIEISYHGFSLSDNGSIEVHKCSKFYIYSNLLLVLQITTDELGHDLENYVGELYRMNLSCSGRELPESGCLFFKVGGLRLRERKSGYVTNGRYILKFLSL